MDQLKNTSIILLLIAVFVGCTEIYNPVIDSGAKALMVEGLLTNGNGPFIVKLTEAKSFNNDTSWITRYVYDAKVKIIDNTYASCSLIYIGSGKYKTPYTFVPSIGSSYKLQVETKDGSIYESTFQKLLPPVNYDSLRPVFTSREYLNNNKEVRIATGAELFVRLFKSVSNPDSIPLCRFYPNITLQYTYPYYLKDTTDWHWIKNEWTSFPVNVTENITPEKSLTTSALNENYSIGFVPLTMSNYGLGADSTLNSYFYLRISFYTMNSDSYRFYKGANAQLSATGAIFDPISSQVYGNMRCINYRSKLVFGLFEVSSVTKAAYIIKKDINSNYLWLEPVPFEDIPLFGLVQYKVWDNKARPMPQNDPDYDRTMPAWWFHN